jgi:hypothetical protein
VLAEAADDLLTDAIGRMAPFQHVRRDGGRDVAITERGDVGPGAQSATTHDPPEVGPRPSLSVRIPGVTRGELARGDRAGAAGQRLRHAVATGRLAAQVHDEGDDLSGALRGGHVHPSVRTSVRVEGYGTALTRRRPREPYSSGKMQAMLARFTATYGGAYSSAPPSMP